MVVATVSDFFLQDAYNMAGRKHFNVEWVAPNFNDTLIECRMVKELLDQALDRDIVITNIEIHYAGQIGTTFHWIYVYQGSRTIGQIPLFVSAAVEEDHPYSNLNMHIAPRLSSDTSNILVLYPVSYAATDDIDIFLRGYIEDTQTTHELQPVSLEGYKWPLARR